PRPCIDNALVVEPLPAAFGCAHKIEDFAGPATIPSAPLLPIRKKSNGSCELPIRHGAVGDKQSTQDGDSGPRILQAILHSERLHLAPSSRSDGLILAVLARASTTRCGQGRSWLVAVGSGRRSHPSEQTHTWGRYHGSVSYNASATTHIVDP